MSNCSACGKPLGATFEKCFECGGTSPQPTREERLQDAVYWKIELGIRWKKIKDAHDR